MQNGPGADLAVFENPLLISGGSGGSFMDLMIVEVSIDGTQLRALAHDYTAANDLDTVIGSVPSRSRSAPVGSASCGS